jgi:flagellar basal-body rod protein FlgG
MIRGMYASAAGMLTGLARQDLYAGNLANANTVGFRRSRCRTQAFAEALSTVSSAGDLLRGGAGPVTTAPDLTEGAVRSTGNPYDLAINGQGFFAVQTPAGMRFTRDGQFHRSAAGQLVDAHEDPVVGVNGAINLPDARFEVDEIGQVKSGGAVIGRLLIADLPAASLRPEGGNLYSSTAIVQRAATARVMQGSLEDSNVSAVQELGQMMSNSRFYEANAAALKQQDQTGEALVKMVE